jgi:protein-tyrosine-phosphatase
MTNVLVLCTGNSARSILGEAILNRLGNGRVSAWSAGSAPRGAPHPVALELLAAKGHETGFARSKSWDEFTAPGAPRMDIVLTVCDGAAAETCPYWPGAPLQVHWGQPDPAATEGPDADVRAAFEAAYRIFAHRARAALALDLDTDPARLRPQLAAIGTLLP